MADLEAKVAREVAREKTFDELDQAGQIQRLRAELIMLRELVNSQQQLIERLMVHKHDPVGEMMVPMRQSGGRFADGRRDGLR